MLSIRSAHSRLLIYSSYYLIQKINLSVIFAHEIPSNWNVSCRTTLLKHKIHIYDFRTLSLDLYMTMNLPNIHNTQCSCIDFNINNPVYKLSALTASLGLHFSREASYARVKMTK